MPEEQIRFTIGKGVGSLIGAAAGGARSPEYTFYLDGDLCQMSAQKRLLQSRGFAVGQNDVYPCLKQEDVEAALRVIWSTRCEGWWHYQKKYAELGICDAETFRAELTAQCERDRNR